MGRQTGNINYYTMVGEKEKIGAPLTPGTKKFFVPVFDPHISQAICCKT